MKVVIFTYDRYKTATTPNIVEESGLDYLVVCHSEEMRKKYISTGVVCNSKKIIASGVSKGLASNRNWYIENYLKDGEWCVMLVDDLINITALDDYEKYDSFDNPALPISIKNSTYWSRKMKKKIPFGKFYTYCEETRDKAISQGISLAGFAAFTNPLFRNKKYKYNVLADGRAWVFQKTELRFDTNVQTIDDYCFSLQNIERLSGVLVNQWILPDCKRYSSGGYGTKDERMEQRKKECAYIVSRFAGAVDYADKKGWEYGTHIKIKNLNASAMANFYMTQKQRGFIK